MPKHILFYIVVFLLVAAFLTASALYYKVDSIDTKDHAASFGITNSWALQR